MSNASHISVRSIDSLKELEGIREDWNTLLSLSPSNSPFLKWEWVFPWAENFLSKNRELSVHVIFEGERLVGIAPWYLRRVKRMSFSMRSLEFLGTPEGGSDYLDMICKEGKEKIVAEEMYRFLFHEYKKKWDILSFKDISANSLFFLHFWDEFEKKGKYVEVNNGAFCPIAMLPEKSGFFFESLSRNRRQQYGRHRRLLERKGKVEHHTDRDFDDLSIFEEFYILYEKRWKKQDNLFKDFLRRLIDVAPYPGFVQIDLLRVDGKAVAGIFHLNFQNSRYYYLMAVDRIYDGKISLGNIIIGLSIEKAIDEGCKEYDFLKGIEPYKFSWTHHGRRLLNYSFYKKNIPSYFCFIEKSSKSFGKILFR